MKISIITVCWNSEKYLKNAIESVLSQTYPDIEYIIVDGGSKDDTLDIVKEYEPQFNGRMKWISEQDKGIYDAMNKGVQLATGNVVGLINSDDFFIDNQSIEKIMSVFVEKQVDCVYADLYYVKEDDTSTIVRKWQTGERQSFKDGWHPAHPTFYIKKEIYNKYGLFDLKYRIAADFEIMLRFLEKHKATSYYVKDYLVKMRLGGESNRSLENIKRGNKEIRDAFAKNDISIPFYYTYKRWFNKLLQYIK